MRERTLYRGLAKEDCLEMRGLLLIAVCAALVAAGVGFYQQKQLELARMERDAQIAEVERVKGEFLESGNTQDEPPKVDEGSELLRLRSEVARLRDKANQAEALAQENSRLKNELQHFRQAEAIPQDTNQTTNYFARDSWSFAGYNTPEAALVSAIWAMKEGNPVTYLDSLSPEEQQRMAKVWESKSEEEVAAKHKSDVAAVSGLRVLEQQETAGGEVQMKVQLDGVNRIETVRMKQIGNEWKFGGFIREQ